MGLEDEKEGDSLSEYGVSDEAAALVDLVLSDRHARSALTRVNSEKWHASVKASGRKRTKRAKKVSADASRKACKNESWIKQNEEMTLKRSVQIVQIEDGLIHAGSQRAAKYTGLSSGNITDTCKGRHKTTGGHHWRYATPDESAFFWAERERTGTDGPFNLQGGQD